MVKENSSYMWIVLLDYPKDLGRKSKLVEVCADNKKDALAYAIDMTEGYRPKYSEVKRIGKVDTEGNLIGNSKMPRPVKVDGWACGSCGELYKEMNGAEYCC